MTLKEIEDCSEAMLSLAKNNSWDVFQQKLSEREAMISRYQQSGYASSLENNKKSDDLVTITKLKAINDELLTLTNAHQQEIQSQLAKLFKEKKASSAYTKG